MIIVTMFNIIKAIIVRAVTIMIIGVFFFIDRRTIVIEAKRCNVDLPLQNMETVHCRSTGSRCTMFELSIRAWAIVVCYNVACFVPRFIQGCSVVELHTPVVPITDPGVATDHGALGHV